MLVPSAHTPRIFLGVDELGELTGLDSTPEEKALAKRFSQQLRRVVVKGRAASITPLLAAQKPDSTIVPTQIRDNMAIRICYGTGNAHHSVAILGEHAVHEQGAAPHNVTTPGIFFMVGESGAKVTRARSYNLSDEDIRGIATRAKAWRAVQ